METIYIALTIFGLTAVFGLYLLSLVLRKKSTPKSVTIIHGVMAAIALIMIIIYAFQNSPGPWPSVVVFTLAAGGGFILNYRDITGKSIPKWLAVGHGLLALTGFGLLLAFAFY
jgi:predicted MFS family arabinose efflux permease